MDSDRVRPEYLPPLTQRRFSFPWLAFWALALLGMVGAGVSLHLKTSNAWTARFSQTAAERFDAIPTVAAPSGQAQPVRPPAPTQPAPTERLNEVGSPSNTRCINGTVLRRIPGGWENIPGMKC